MKRAILVWLTVLLFGATPSSSQKGKRQVTAKPFTHAEVVQFVHTLQTQAASWKDTINSIEPSALHINSEEAEVIEGYKSVLLVRLNEMEKLHPSSLEKNKADDLFDEFNAFSDLGEAGEILSQLGDTLSSYAPSGQLEAGRLLQIKTEVNETKLTLYAEILSRIVNIARSEESGASLASAQSSDNKKGTQVRDQTPVIPLDVRADSWSGAKWMKLPPEEKASYVAGVMDGITLAPVLFQPNPNLPPALFNADSKTPTTLEIANGLDALYSTPENLPLCMDHAVLIEWMRLAGHRMPASSIEKMRELSGQTGCRLNSKSAP